MIDPTDVEEPEFETGDEFEDEPQDFFELDEPDLDWFDCPILPRSDMLAVVERCRLLDGRGINLFGNALKLPPRSGLLDRYIGPSLYQPGSHYIYTTPDPSRYRYKNWRPEVTAAAIEHQSIAACGLF